MDEKEKAAQEALDTAIEANKALMENIAKQDEEIKLLGEAKESTIKQLKEQDDKYAGLLGDLTATLKDVAETKERCSKLEVEVQDKGEPGAEIEEMKFAGEKFTDSDIFKAVEGSSGSFTSGSLDVGSFRREMREDLILRHERKVLSSAAASAGDLAIPFFDMEIYKRPDRTPKLRDMLAAGPIAKDSVSYFLRTGFFPLSTTLSALEAAGQMTISLTSVDGFYAGQVVLIGDETWTVVSVDVANVTIDIGAPGLAVQWIAGTRVSSQFIAPQTELSPKGESDLTYDEQTRNVQTIAAWIRVSKQIFSDVDQLSSEINNDLMYSLLLTEEQQILYGDNTGTNLQGITTSAGIQLRLWSGGEAGDTRVDTISRGAGDCSSIDYPINGVVCNPFDLIAMNLEKAADGHYLYQGGIANFLGFPVISSAAIAQGTALVGSFGFAAKLRDRQEAAIRTTENYNDDFVRNALVVLAEERFVQYVPLPEGFCLITFDAAPAA